MSINRSKNKPKDIFDDDFEVIYQEDHYSTLLRNELARGNQDYNDHGNKRGEYNDSKDGYDDHGSYDNVCYDWGFPEGQRHAYHGRISSCGILRGLGASLYSLCRCRFFTYQEASAGGWPVYHPAGHVGRIYLCDIFS